MSGIDPASVVLHNRIGEGGIASVWLADWQGRQVAMKILRRLDHAGLRQRFVREGQLLSRLDHPGIVRCLGVIDAEQPALLLELLRGEPLDRRIARGPLGAVEGERLAGELLRILEYLHGQNIVHRDVKSGNVWWGADGRIVLMDLGLAADPSDPLTSTLGEVVGTHAYMAPEQIAGAEMDQRCDLYSLGVTLYEALAGARPYQARGLAGYLAAHRSGRAVPLRERCPHLPSRLTTLVDRLMARDPAARPPTARAAMLLLLADPAAAGGLERPSLVGREAVRGALAAVLDGGGALALVGEAGSGLGAAGALAVRMAGEAGVDVIRARAGREALAERIAAQLPEPASGAAPRPMSADAVLAELEGLGGEGRLLVLVEDAHAATTADAALLERMSAVPGLALVATSQAPLATPGLRALPLRALRPEETRTLVGRLLGGGAIPPGFDAAVHAIGRGRPGWTVSIVRDARTRGALVPEGRDEAGRPRWRWDAAAMFRMTLPPGVEPGRLLEGLPVASRALLEVLAVAGLAIPLRVALAASGGGASGADLGPLVRQGLVAAPGGDEELVRVGPPDLAAVVRDSLGEEGARRVGEALAAVAPEWASRARLARPLGGEGAGGEPAGPGALLRLAWADLADGWADRALSLADGPAPPVEAAAEVAVEADRALLRVEAWLALGRLPEARQALPAARLLARASGREGEGSLVEARLLLAAGQELPPSLDAALPALGASPAPPGGSLPAAELVRAERARRAGEPEAATEILRGLPPASPAFDVERRVALADVLLLRGEVEAAAEVLAVATPESPLLSAWLSFARVPVLLAQADVPAALAACRPPWEGGALARALRAVARLEVEVALGVPADGAPSVRVDAPIGAETPWPARRRYLQAIAMFRLAQQDRPAALDALLLGADAARAAGDIPENALLGGIAGLLTGREERVGRSMEQLGGARFPRHEALLLALGARFTGDPEVLVAAELAARHSGDRLLLLGILYALRGSGAREEAARIATDALRRLHGPERGRFLERREVRWALLEHAPA